MITRIHRRGTNFKTAIAYILHDPQQETANRVDWQASLNCGSVETSDAWRVMYETWDRRTALKRENGIDLRGADNKAPVMHYTLSWAPGDRPSKQEMMDAALKSLAALGLEQHQAALAAHNDKDHLHVHIIVNTVNPETGRTASLKYPALALRQFAREYEHGRAIEEARREAASHRLPPVPRRNDLRAQSMAMLRPNDMLEKIRPEPRQPHHRRRAMEHADVINRMKRHRAENDHAHLVEKDALWAVHRAERNDLFERSKGACGVALDYVRDRFKSRWRDLYEAQRIEWKHVERIQHNPLERAVYVIVNSERLGNGAPLSMKDKAALIASPKKLFKAVEQLHNRERRAMAQVEKVEIKARLDRVWHTHEASFGNMKDRQNAEREQMRREQQITNDRSISYAWASLELEYERRGLLSERQAANAAPFETDEMYVSRVRQDIDQHYRRQFGADGVPFIEWKDAARPPASEDRPELSPEPPTRVVPSLKEPTQEQDFDNERE